MKFIVAKRELNISIFRNKSFERKTIEHKFDVEDVRFGHLNWAINKNYVK